MSKQLHLARRRLIEAGIDPNRLEAAAWPFLKACRQGPLELLEALLVCGYPTGADANGCPAVIRAAESGRHEHVEAVLAHGGTLDTFDGDRETALHTAVNFKHIALCRWLCERGAPVNSVNRNGISPLCAAVRADHQELTRILLGAGADPNLGKSPLFAAKGAPMVELLLESGADPNQRLTGGTEPSLLFDWTEDRKLAEVELLLTHGAKDVPSATGWTAAMWVHDADDKELAQLFEKHGLAPDPRGDTRAIAAARRGDLPALRALAEAGLSLDATDHWGFTPLITAAAHEQWALVDALIEMGADPAIMDPNGTSLLGYVALHARMPLLQRLIALGVPSNHPVARCPALVVAAAQDEREVLQALIAAGADLASRDSKGQTALYVASWRGRHEVLTMLLEAGAPLNAVTGNKTPLLSAQGAGQIEVVRSLIAAGADLDWVADDGTALIRCARADTKKEQMAAIAALLLEAGADHRPMVHCDTALGFAARENAAAYEVLCAYLCDRVLERHTEGGRCDWSAVARHADRELLTVLVRRNDVAAITALIEAGLPEEVVKRGPKSAIHCAVTSRDPAVALELLQVYSGLVTSDDPDEDPLVAAAGRGHADLVQWLLDHGADPDAVRAGRTALCASTSLEVTRLLLRAGASPNPFPAGISPLLTAAHRGTAELVRLLLSHGADPDCSGLDSESPLDIAQKRKDAAMVAALAEVTSVDVADAKGRTALLRAAIKGDLDLIDRLLQRGADPDRADAQGHTPKSVAAFRAEAAERLGVPFAPIEVSMGADDELFATARRNLTLAAAKTDVRARNGRGDTLLHIAALLNHPQLAEDLITMYEADVDASNRVGDTPWSLALLGASEVVATLELHGAKVNVEQQFSTATRFHAFGAAVNAGDLLEFRRFVDEGLVNRHILRQHVTPLSLAVASGDEPMVDMLLRMGCDPLVWGDRLLAEACQRNDTAILGRLIEAGLEPTSDAVSAAARAGSVAALNVVLAHAAPPPGVLGETRDAASVQCLETVARAKGWTALADDAHAMLRVMSPATTVGLEFRREFGSPATIDPTHLKFGRQLQQAVWDRLYSEIGAGEFDSGFAYLFGSRLERLKPCLEAWSSVLDSGVEWTILGCNRMGMLLVAEDLDLRGVVAPVHLLDPLAIRRWTDPDIGFINLIGNWLPQRRLPGFLDRERYDAWCAASKSQLAADEVLGTSPPHGVGGPNGPGELKPLDILAYYQATAETLRERGNVMRTPR